MASSIVQSAAQQLGKLLVEEVKFLYGVQDKVEELQVELAWMQVFLQDADKKQHQDDLIRMWVSQIRDLAYEAEDVVEKYIHKVSQLGRDKFWNTLPKKLSCVVYNASALHEVGSDIDKLTGKISKLNKRLKSYGVEIKSIDNSHYITRIRDMRRTYANTVDQDLIKREEDIKKLVSQLRESTQQSNVVGIVGMGGLGKTTLAREVYRDKAITDSFGDLVWIYVSPQPQKRSILEDTLGALRCDSESFSRLSDDSLSVEVQKVLSERRCLVVLDDIWTKETRFLKQSFANSNSKAMLLLTTRYENEVRKMDPNAFILRPTELKEEEGWRLLCNKASIKENELARIDSELVEVGKTMLKHCKGLPIAIVALGGILATKPRTVIEWKEVEKHIHNYLAKDINNEDDEMGVDEVLELSYNELPYYMKPCFLYLGNFPEKLEIPTITLYQLWQAEGLIRAPEKNKRKGRAVHTYDIAEQYLEELVKRCMVEVGELYENGGIKTCRLHDIMRDLCLKKSEEDKFLEVVTTDDPELTSPYGSFEPASRQVWTTHRVAIRMRDKKSADSFFDALQENEVQLRSLIMDLPQDYTQGKFGKWVSNMYKAFNLLRVLRLEGGKIKKLPDELEKCIHLRYLSFQLIHESEVPKVVWKLNYLQTLDLQYNHQGLCIPANKLVKLKRLVHLYLPGTYKVTGKLRFSQPWQIETLVNIDLKDLHADDMVKMKNLRMLSFKKSSESMDGESLSLVLKCNIITSSLLENPISNLCIDAETINQDPRILGSSPNAKILMLTVTGIIKPSLKTIVFPRTLVSLELYGCRVQGDCIPELKIHGLKELHLKENAIRGKKIVLSSQSFPELKKLTLEWPTSSQLSEVEGTLPYRCLFSISCPRSLEDKISVALHQFQHNSDFQRVICTDPVEITGEVAAN